MAIDLLSRITCTPIVVGDSADMGHFRRGRVSRVNDIPTLVLKCEAGTEESFMISIEAARNVSSSEYILFVSLSTKDKIASAILSPYDDDSTITREIKEPEVKRFAEDLVAGAFEVDWLQAEAGCELVSAL